MSWLGCFSFHIKYSWLNNLIIKDRYSNIKTEPPAWKKRKILTLLILIKIKNINIINMMNLFGRATEDLCTAMQNYLNQFGDQMTDQQKEEWIDDFYAYCVN